MSGWKQWQVGEVVDADDFQSYVQDQVVQVYASSAARGSALGTAVSAGMVSYLLDSGAFQVYGTAWATVGGSAISGGTAGQAFVSNGTAAPGFGNVAAEYITTAVRSLASNTTAYTAVAADQNDFIYSLATATVTLTFPNAALDIGDRVDVIRDGAGTVVLAAGSGVTSWAGAGTAGTAVTFKIDQQYNAATIVKVADATYRVIGKVTV